MKTRLPPSLVLCLLSAATWAAPAPKPSPRAEAVDPALLAGLEWRNVGPYRGGRVVAVAGVATQPRAYYFGGTGGGVWKTTDGGASWSNVSDGQLGTGSVGAIAVAESDPNVVYAGMGEGCIRGNVSHGDGVYRSTDAGRTWTNVGLRDTRQIGRLRVHPRDPDLVYVAALGHAFGPNQERGVFRSKDGGKTWQSVLFVDDSTGAIDLALDPANPRILYAAMWQVVRKPWTLESGGPGGGLYKSQDGGDTWKKLTGEGLPKGIWGRIGVAVSPARHERVWAQVEAEEGGLYRSDDAGRTWQRVNEDRSLRQRAWYYTHVFADPKNADTVYVLNVRFHRSQDGGKTFKPVRTPHGDNHDLWIAPDDPQRMIAGNDGGAHVSLDGGASWTRQDNQPTAQLYHVAVDDDFPYRLYGAQQDNSTVAIASRTGGSGIDRTDWYEVGGCESGYVAPRPKHPAVVFAGCYDGVITRYDHRTGQQREVSVYPDNPMGWGAEGMKYRFQWTFPIVFSPHDANTLYAAGNVLFRTTNEGQSWEAISPDLTRNDPKTLGPSGGPITKDNTSVEYYGTIFAVAESPLEQGLLWTGSDDGRLHVTRDGGRSWVDVTPKDLPEWSMVSQIDASPHEAGTAWVAVNRYKLDDFRPFVYVTRDYGKTWANVAGNLPADAFVRVVREDPVRKGLLFAGTETGVFVSFDAPANREQANARWQPLRLALPGSVSPDAKPDEPRRLPLVPVTDLAVKGSDLVAATQGRSFWILDDIAPLRQMKPELAAVDVHLFEPSPAVRFFGGGRPQSNAGQNPPNGALLYYFLKAEPKEKEELVLEILDASGKVIRKVTSKGDPEVEKDPNRPEWEPPPPKLPARAGLNRFAWDLRHEPASRFKGLILWGGGLRGPVAVPGTYTARLTAGATVATASFEVRKDPRLSVSQADLEKQLELLVKVRDKLTAAHDAVQRIRATREQVEAAAARAKGTAAEKAVAEAAEPLEKALTAIEEELYQTKNKSEQDPLNFPIRLNNKLSWLASVAGSADAAATDAAYAVYADVAGRIDAQLAKLEQVLAGELGAFNALVREKQVPAVVVKDK